MTIKTTFGAGLVIISLFKFTVGYTCSTSNEEQGITSEDALAHSHRAEPRWTDGVVQYHLNSSLEQQDIATFYLAIEEYHKKTCIRFEPHKRSDPNYTSIELDKNVPCGLGNVCMRGGYQYAKIGRHCRKLDTMVHELGHNLCLTHEHQRKDRDLYVSYKTCNITKHGKNTEIQFQNPVRGFYDYLSQMHYDCMKCNEGGFPTIPSVKLCGSQVTKGLSFLDADYLNEMYNCGGCFRHRWIPKKYLKNSDRIYDLAQPDLNNILNAPCRTMANGEVAIGKYNPKFGTCSFAYGGRETTEYSEFEIFTVPGGRNDSVSEYYLVEVRDGNLDAVVSNAVAAGHLSWADGTGYGNSYVAYGRIPGGAKSCGGHDEEIVIGKATWTMTGKSYAYFSTCKGQHQLLDYSVLACKMRKINDVGLYSKKDIYTNWKLKHMETIQGVLQTGSTISVIGYINNDAETFFVDLCQNTSSGPIILHYNPRFDWDGAKNASITNSLSNEKWIERVQRNLANNFPFSRGRMFKLVILCLDGFFNFTVNGMSAGRYAHRQSPKGEKFVRIHGDVTIMHVEIKGTEKECGNGIHFGPWKFIGGDKMKYIMYGVVITVAFIGLLAIYVAVRVILRLAGRRRKNTTPAETQVPLVRRR